MPNSKSAAKRVRQNEKRRIRNKMRKTELKTLARRVEFELNAGRVEEARTAYRRYTKRVDQASCKHVLHPNTAARHKSRLAAKLAVAAG